MFSILTSAKSFNHHWIGHSRLNQNGLHLQRLIWAQRCANLRRLIRSPDFSASSESSKLKYHIRVLETDGYIAIEDFLPRSQHEAISAELENAIEQVGARVPIIQNDQPGFGSKQFFNGGFDRYDGGTLNRFIDIQPKLMPQLAAFSRNPEISALTRTIVGRSHQHRKTNIYLMVHGNEAHNHDLQKDFHRDTFFSAMKFWYFPKAVTMADGPFVYVPGSHKLTPQRLQWEHETALAAITSKTQPNVGGSFRISEAELPDLDLPQPVALTCPANTLVLANVFGFHRRGDAEAGRQRLSVYGWQRPGPFMPV